ncbi:MAG: acetyl-CoA hydrolase/transferase C-terminal domain-containing protein [Myxococcota bacterium]
MTWRVGGDMDAGVRDWRSRAQSPEDVLSHLESGQRVFVHGACATPTPLVKAMAAQTQLEGVQLYHLHLAGELGFEAPENKDRFFSNSLFTGPGLRKPIAEARADFVPVFLSDIPGLFTEGVVPLDVAIVQLSPPNAHGQCTLGTSVDAALAAVGSAKVVLAEINTQMPRTLGHSVVPMEAITAFTCTDRPLVAHPPNSEEGPTEARIGEIIADLVDDGSTLQMGIGAIPDAALARLKNKLELGVHTEMFSDRLVDLVECGAVTNRQKKVHPGRSVTSFVAGSQRLFEFVHDNQEVEFHPCDRTNDTALIRKNPKVVAINSAIEIDLSGQVCADSIGFQIFSGIGGQMDFVRGAVLSPGGKAIIALPSTAARGQVSRISAALKQGAGVVTTRGHVEWIVTEYGAVNLHGKNLRQRGEALISIAHPDFRPQLTKELCEVRHYTL